MNSNLTKFALIPKWQYIASSSYPKMRIDCIIILSQNGNILQSSGPVWNPLFVGKSEIDSGIFQTTICHQFSYFHFWHLPKCFLAQKQKQILNLKLVSIKFWLPKPTNSDFYHYFVVFRFWFFPFHQNEKCKPGNVTLMLSF